MWPCLPLVSNVLWPLIPALPGSEAFTAVCNIREGSDSPQTGEEQRGETIISSWEAAVTLPRSLAMACQPSKWLVLLPVKGKAQSFGYMCLTCFMQPEALNKALVALPCWNAVRR